jgi:hypothetical protein
MSLGQSYKNIVLKMTECMTVYDGVIPQINQTIHVPLNWSKKEFNWVFLTIKFIYNNILPRINILGSKVLFI